MQAQQVQKEFNRQSYNQELNKAVQLKREQENLERAYRAGERDQMLRAVDYKQMQDRNQMENHRMQQKLFGAEA